MKKRKPTPQQRRNNAKREQDAKRLESANKALEKYQDRKKRK